MEALKSTLRELADQATRAGDRSTAQFLLLTVQGLGGLGPHRTLSEEADDMRLVASKEIELAEKHTLRAKLYTAAAEALAGAAQKGGS